MQAPPGLQKTLHISSWYISSSTSSSTMTKEEYLGTVLNQFWESEHEMLHEEVARGGGDRMEALSQLAFGMRQAEPELKHTIRKACLSKSVAAFRNCVTRNLQQHQFQM